jgi:hypothetical protein
MDTRFNVSSALELTPRRISAPAALLALTVIQTRAPKQREAVPAGMKGVFDDLTEEVGAAIGRLQASLDLQAAAEAPPVEEIELPAELLKLADEATLRDRRGMNNLLDVWTGGLASLLEGLVFQPGAKGEDARALMDAWFGDGRGFLNAPHATQWLEIDRRWGRLRPEDQARLQRLGLWEHAQTLVTLNGWFGQLLQITRDADAPAAVAPDADPLPDILRTLTRVLLFANLAWPGDAPEAVERRQRLAGPYLAEIQKVSAKYATNAKQRAQDDEP